MALKFFYGCPPVLSFGLASSSRKNIGIRSAGCVTEQIGIVFVVRKPFFRAADCFRGGIAPHPPEVRSSRIPLLFSPDYFSVLVISVIFSLNFSLIAIALVASRSDVGSSAGCSAVLIPATVLSSSR